MEPVLADMVAQQGEDDVDRRKKSEAFCSHPATVRAMQLLERADVQSSRQVLMYKAVDRCSCTKQ